MTLLAEGGDSSANGDWIEFIEVGDKYIITTRVLPISKSDIVINVQANTTGFERRAKITVVSFTKSDTIEIIQSAEEESILSLYS